MVIKEEPLNKVKKFQNTGSGLSSDEIEAFQQLNQQDQLEIVQFPVNPIAMVQISSVIKDPIVQSEMLCQIENSRNTFLDKKDAIKSIVNNISDPKVLKEAMYTAFDVADNKDQFKEMFSFQNPGNLLYINKVNQILGKEPIKGKNEGMRIDPKIIEKAYNAMESVGKPLTYEKKDSLEKNTEFTSTVNKILNAIKDLLGINDVKAAVRRDLKNAVSEIAKGFTIDSKSIDESKKNSETKSQSFQLQ